MSADILNIADHDPLRHGMPDDEEELKALVKVLGDRCIELEAPAMQRNRIKNLQKQVTELRKLVRGYDMGLGANSVEHERVTTMGGVRA